MSKIMTAREAIDWIQDGNTFATSGIAGAGVPQYLLETLREKFLETGHPCGLNAIFAAGAGARDGRGGIDRYALEGLIATCIGGHFGTSPTLANLIRDNKVAGWNMPQGVINDMYHAAIKGMPYHITKLGLKTFVDPRLEGGILNEKAREIGNIVKVVEIEGEEYLAYKAPKLDIAMIRGTTADKFGNISLEDEALPVDMQQVAMAAKACGGKVIVQVKYIVDRLMTDKVVIPGVFVDAVVKCENPYDLHRATLGIYYDPTVSGHGFIEESAVAALPFDAKKIIVRRAAMELKPGAIINLGIGTPEGVANLCAEEGCADLINMTSESGAVAGIPMGGLDFGAVQNAWAVIPAPTQFDFYDGGGLDCTFLGLAETDPLGNVNVSRFGTGITGCGGFINISQTTPKIVYCGTFTAKGLKETVENGKLVILQEGKNKKFLNKIQQISYSGEFGAETGQEAYYVTERAVFKLVKGGIELIEIAPGIDLQKDVLDQMEFKPIMNDVKIMDAKIFTDEPMGLRDIILSKG